MKFIYLIALLIIPSTVTAQEDPGTFVPPGKPRLSSYRTLWEQSPFTEKVIAVVEQGPGFAENLVLEGIMSLGGEDVACIVDSSTDEILYVRATEPTRGITLVEIKNRQNIDQASVVLASGSEQSTLTFSDEKLVVGPGAGAAPQNPASEQANKRGAPAPTQQTTQEQQVTSQSSENTTLTEEQMRERRRQFWESMRDRRSRGRR